MEYVDKINMKFGGEGTKLYSTAGTSFKKLCLQNKLNLLDASVRHLGTDINYIVLKNLYDYLENKVDFYFDTPVENVELKNGNDKEGYLVDTADENYECKKCIVSVGRSGSKWMEHVCHNLNIPTKSNRVDIGVRVELPAAIFSHLTDELYESKIVYRTEQFEDNVRTFCMNPKGCVVNENTNGIITVMATVMRTRQNRQITQTLHSSSASIFQSLSRTATVMVKALPVLAICWAAV